MKCCFESTSIWIHEKPPTMFRHFMKDYQEEPQTKEKRWEGRIGAQAPAPGSHPGGSGGWTLCPLLSRTAERNKQTHNSCKFKVLGSYSYPA